MSGIGSSFARSLREAHRAFGYTNPLVRLPTHCSAVPRGAADDRGSLACAGGQINRGFGIRILSAKELPSFLNACNRVGVVQRYVRPLLIGGLKFDLRVYVLVTTFGPTRAYVARDGLARFASRPFVLDDPDRLIHLTNVAVQKKHPTKGVDGSGERSAPYWTLDQLWAEFAEQGLDVEGIRRSVDEVRCVS